MKGGLSITLRSCSLEKTWRSLENSTGMDRTKGPSFPFTVRESFSTFNEVMTEGYRDR